MGLETATRIPLGARRKGKHFVDVTKKCRKVEWATVMKKVADALYPHTEKIIVVLDNLNPTRS